MWVFVGMFTLLEASSVEGQVCRKAHCVMLPLILFSDDTSGNKSKKKWHLFDSWSITLAGLPRHENLKISNNIHFFCCSDKASAIYMHGHVYSNSTRSNTLREEGVEAYDASSSGGISINVCCGRQSSCL